MKKVSAAILSLLACVACAPAWAARPAKAALSALPAPAPAQSECVAGNANKGEGKFTGQISGGPTGTMIEVTSGKDSLVVVYNDSVLICEGGQLSSARALALGATVVAYGRFEKKGKSPQMIATKILVAGPPAGANNGAMTQGNWDRSRSNPGSDSPPASGSVAGRDDWQGGSQGSSNSQNSGASQGSGSVAGQDDWQRDSTGGAKGGNGQNSTAISCSALLFSITSHEDPSGKMGGRPSTSGITCRMPVDQQALQLTQDALNGRHVSALKLDCQNQLEAMLNNVEISGVQFTTDGGSQVVDVTFIAQKVEITHVPSGTRVTF
jgi:hypothetical protein